jgi:hypothetical protein
LRFNLVRQVESCFRRLVPKIAIQAQKFDIVAL